MLRKKWSIAFVIILALSIIISAILLLYTYQFSRYGQLTSLNKLNKKAFVYSQQLSQALALPLWNYDTLQISKILESQMSDQEVYELIITEDAKENNLQIVSRNANWEIIKIQTPVIPDEAVSSVSAIVYEKRSLGWITVVLSQKFNREEIQHEIRTFLKFIILLIIVLVSAIFSLLWLIVIKPIKNIEKYAISYSNHQVTNKSNRSNYFRELDVLNSSLTEMINALGLRFTNLQESEQRFKALFEKTPVSIWLEDTSGVFGFFQELRDQGITDLDDFFLQSPKRLFDCLSNVKIVDVNQASLNLFRAESKSQLVDNIQRTFTESSMQAFKRGLLALWNKELEYRGETEFKRLNGDLMYAIIHWNQISFESSIKYLLLSINDITSQKILELELKKKNDDYYSLNEELSENNLQILEMNEALIASKEKAEESDRLKTAFLANMSHEIRTPLNAIVGFSGLLYDSEKSDNSLKKYATIVQNSSGQLLSIVNDILTISRIQTGQEIMSIKTVRLNSLIDNLWNIFLPEAKKKKIEFLYHKALSNELSLIETDETKLTQIVSNLLNNALKFTKQGTIEFGYNLEENQLIFYVKDTGIGIAEEAQKIIFERFRQAEVTTSSIYGGTGLGLSISKAYSEMLEGDLTVSSKVDEGSVFRLSIPFKPIKQQEIIITDENLPQITKTLSILVAEDEDTNYSLLEELLLREKIQLSRAHNGQEAVELFTNHPNFDIILMDIKMPVMDGITAFFEIRKINATIPIIAQTAYALEHEKLKLLKKGFNEYLAKPLQKGELLAKIYKFV